MSRKLGYNELLPLVFDAEDLQWRRGEVAVVTFTESALSASQNEAYTGETVGATVLGLENLFVFV